MYSRHCPMFIHLVSHPFVAIVTPLMAKRERRRESFRIPAVFSVAGMWILGTWCFSMSWLVFYANSIWIWNENADGRHQCQCTWNRGLPTRTPVAGARCLVPGACGLRRESTTYWSSCSWSRSLQEAADAIAYRAVTFYTNMTTDPASHTYTHGVLRRVPRFPVLFKLFLNI